MSQLSKTLHFFVKNDENNYYTIDVNVRDDEDVTSLSTIVELIPKDQHSVDITFKTHEFEVRLLVIS